MTVDEFIARWEESGGGERANTQSFINELCALIGVEGPDTTKANVAANDYVFERRVEKVEIDGTTSKGWIDCYKRDSFILEAKQGSDSDRKAVDEGAAEDSALKDFYGQTAKDRYVRGTARRGTAQWTAAMQRAAGQAEGYAKALPNDWPPFLLVSDIGHCIDVYADFQRGGKGYSPFPDRKRSRIMLNDLRDEQVRERLRAIWTVPLSLDPSAEAARVTRTIADLLARLAKDIEAREQNPDRVAAFLMRLLFTMFAEDTGLIPKASFSAMLAKVRDRPENLPPMLSDLWAKMDQGGFVGALGAAGETVRKFNGYLFKETAAIVLTTTEIDVLIAAARSDWRQVEPAIFGTLLERALDPKERAKLGAHYTPRAYVERLVGPTIMEPLREDWMGARTAATEAAEAGDKAGARQLVEDFHGKLAQTRVLDPACGTGNFLYIAMARMKELEGEVLELLEELGDDQYLAEISGHTITPENFLGIEINPRAAEIAQLVLWIGYLQWHFRVVGENRMPPEPVLRDVRTIECRDALIEWDRKELELDDYGRPVTRWDGVTMKKHPATGKNVPDENARLEVYRYICPRAAKWPAANFIIGNPPFVGVRRLNERLSPQYVIALRSVFNNLPGTIDFVMYWWDHAARLVRSRRARRFGLITTNSIVQDYSRPVVECHIDDPIDPLYLAYAVTNHPWVENKDGAAVDVAMTVGMPMAESSAARLTHIKKTRGGYVSEDSVVKRINAALKNIPDVFSAKALNANSGICFQGVVPAGDGFKIADAEQLGGVSSTVRPYMIGDDLTKRFEHNYIIDFFGLSASEAAIANSPAYAKVLSEVKPEREHNPRPSYKEKWWIYAEPRPKLRKALKDIDRFIATPNTARHRPFVFIDASYVPDAMIYCVASEDPYFLGVLSSSVHQIWCKYAGGTLQDRPRYNSDRTFLPFPFPGASDEPLKDRIRADAESLDALRKDVLARHSDLTLTKLYNALDSLRAAEAAGAVLSDKDRDVAERGCVTLIRHYHDAIDIEVAEAYGWGDLVDEKNKHLMDGPGRADWPKKFLDGPAGARRDGRLRADIDELILERLVTLNKERAAEEARGVVRWLRPDLQQVGYIAPVVQSALNLAGEAKASTVILTWPSRLPDQVIAVAGVVMRAARPIDAAGVARAFKGKRAGSVMPVLDALAGMGRLRKLQDGRYAA